MRIGSRRYTARRPRRSGPIIPLPNFRLSGWGNWGGWLHRHRHDLLIVGKVCLSLVLIGHLALLFLLPGGRNLPMSWDAREALPHLTLFRAPDAFGFPGPRDTQGFVRYQVFEQSGEIREGVFPNPRVKPDLRFQRWAAAGDAVSAPNPVLHEQLLTYLLENLPSPPFRVELYTGRWQESLPPPDAIRALPAPEQRKVGTHNGLTQEWASADEENPAK